MPRYYVVNVSIQEMEDENCDLTVGRPTEDSWFMTTDNPVNLRNYLQRLAQAEPDGAKIIEIF